MCGIWGVVHKNGQQASEAMAQRAVEAMAHRGPDDSGVFVRQGPLPVALANTRLSIIDLSDAGHMPMGEPSGRYTIAYNGEVYNFAETRAHLAKLGHTFQSATDTEVILHAYMEWGPACLQHLRGMFAFAIWDAHTATLFAARDRLGIKPLYITHSAEHFAFASEIKALLTTGLAERRLNPTALHHYLSFYAVPSPHTMLEGVEALPPAHCLTYHNGELTIEQYWQLPPISPLDLPEAEILARLRHLLEESIRLRMIADVPVGAFLSGGIDSGAVVALMTRATGERLRTFSIGFGEEGRAIDERSAARTMAERYGTHHTEVVISGGQVRSAIDAIIAAMDQPTGDGLNTYLVSQATAQHGKVALSGVGGDELFAGYPQFRLFQRADQVGILWQRLPGVARSVARGAAAVVEPARRALTWVDGDLLERYSRVRVLFSEAAKADLYASVEALPESSLEYLSRFVCADDVGSTAQLTRLELGNYMAHTLLRDTDAMSMAHSLEVRVPLIDHELVEFAACIPASMKLRDGRGKWALTEALSDVLPPEVIERPKRGFEMPVAAWMRSDLRDVLDDVYTEASIRARGLFDVNTMQAVYADFREGRAATYMHTWALAVLELWMRHTLDQ